MTKLLLHMNNYSITLAIIPYRTKHILNYLERMKETSKSYAFTLHALVRIEKSFLKKKKN